MRYAAFLRGVFPGNLAMSELRSCLESAGLRKVRTLLASGNVVFESPAGSTRALERRVEKAMQAHLAKVFMTFVRSEAELEELVSSDPYRAFRLRADGKRLVTFMREPPAADLRLPIEQDGARLLHVEGVHAFSTYLPNPRGPVFMQLIERTLGKDATTRSWDTVTKVRAALRGS